MIYAEDGQVVIAHSERVTPERAETLARRLREIAAEARAFQRRYIIVFDNGNVYDVLTSSVIASKAGNVLVRDADCRLVARGPNPSEIGYTQPGVGGWALSITEIPVTGRDGA